MRKWSWVVVWAAVGASMQGCNPAGRQSGDPAPQPRSPDTQRKLFSWEGEVDGEDVVKFQGGESWVEHRRHLPAKKVAFSMANSLRESDFPVVLVQESGRGKVRVVRQGDATNAYTLSVIVDDNRFGGFGAYRFSGYAPAAAPSEVPAFGLRAEIWGDAAFRVKGGTLEVSPPEAARNLKYFIARPFSPVDPVDFRLRVLRGSGSVEIGNFLDSNGFGFRISRPTPEGSVHAVELYSTGRATGGGRP